jgi:hypothetical protein
MLKKDEDMLHSTSNREPTTVINLTHNIIFSMQSLRFLFLAICFCRMIDFFVMASILLRIVRSKRFILYLLFLLGVCGRGLRTLPLRLFAGGISADPVFVSIMVLFLWFGYGLFALILKW